jgi:putative FmdB family regulatory protein
VTNDYICLKCGKQFELYSSAEKKCPKCGSTNVLKVSPTGVFGFSGGGGG